MAYTASTFSQSLSFKTSTALGRQPRREAGYCYNLQIEQNVSSESAPTLLQPRPGQQSYQHEHIGTRHGYMFTLPSKAEAVDETAASG